MATMVLTAVGSAVGGPIGAAVGSLVGQYLDREVIFRPKRRESARLADLRVQVSSYGVAIPRLFGTMRVAGSVVWATDLLERRSDGRAGKGSPTVTSYSYAASFAVLLSARPILAVGRVWADGKLLRGAAGTLKAAGAMRVHLGGEDQAPDPLIASAEGEQAPAHRGCAYAVFEGLALADFGNRIPSLTFEVVADAGPVTVGAVARALAPALAGDAGFVLDGFAAEGDLGEAVASLAAAAGGWLAADGGRVRLGGDGAIAAVVADDGVAVEGDPPGHGRSVAALAEVPRVVSVAHFDPARDWQAGSQRAVRGGAGGREQRLALPAAMAPAAAKAIAATMLARAGAERTRRTVAPGLAGWALRPGQVVGVAGEDGRWRVERVAIERMAATATLVPIAPATLPAPATGGRAVSAPDLAAGATLIRAAELPPLGEVRPVQPRLSVVAAGTGAGWRRAALLLSLDEGASWEEVGSTAAPGAIGVVAVPPGADGTIEVVLATAHMTLAGAEPGALDRGANLALVGGELVQFGQAVPLAGNRWRLGALRRGRHGTGAAVGLQVAGDRFTMLDPAAVRAIDLPWGAVSGSARIMAAGIDDGVEPPIATVAVTGVSVAPPAPIGLHATMVGHDLAIAWSRGGEVAPGGDRATYLVAIDAGDEQWEIVTIVPAASVTGERRAGRALTIAVRERGPLIDSPATMLTIV